MEEPIPDLIPDDLGAGPGEPRPLAILRAQAKNLASKTGNVVLAKVVRLDLADYPVAPLHSRFARSRSSHEGRMYGFNLVVPALEDYTYQAFRISYPVAEAFPVSLSGALIEKEERIATDGPGFIETLGEIFSSQQFRKVVNSLMSEAGAPTA